MVCVTAQQIRWERSAATFGWLGQGLRILCGIAAIMTCMHERDGV